MIALLENAMLDRPFDDYVQADEELAQAGYLAAWYNYLFKSVE